MKQTERFLQEVRWLVQEKYGGARGKEAEKDVARLEQGELVDYVIGWVDFAGCRIDLSQRPFIPRPETEYWVEKVIQELRGWDSRNRVPLRPASRGYAAPAPSISRIPSPPLHVLDIFAGSGCIGVAVLKHVPYARVDFAEKEPRFLRQIERNAELNGIEKSRYRVLRSDVFSGVKRKYDYILANPPYVAETRRDEVQQSVRKQEPYGAVFGGTDGLLYIRQLVHEAKRYLVPGGVLYLEFDSPQKAQIAQGKCFKDQYNKWRYARIVF